jgi:hypothetical protein
MGCESGYLACLLIYSETIIHKCKVFHYTTTNTMTFDHHLMFFMDTQVNNIMQGIIIFSAKFGCCFNE